MRLTYLEVFLKRRGPELLPLAEPLHCCQEIIFAITTAAKKENYVGNLTGMRRMVQICAVPWMKGQKP